MATKKKKATKNKSALLAAVIKRKVKSGERKSRK